LGVAVIDEAGLLAMIGDATTSDNDAE
jgi:hypothetical protein